MTARDSDRNELQQYAALIQPLITRIDDQRWRAQYPGLSWHVVADSESAAASAITEEALRRFDAGEPEAQPPDDLLQRHLQRPVEGVYALDRDLFLYLRAHAGQAETLRAFQEAERRRGAGLSYTKSDYLAERSAGGGDVTDVP